MGMRFSAKLDKRAVIPAGIVLCAVTVLLRTVQLFTIVDPATGYYTQGGALRMLLPLVAVVGLAVAALLLSGSAPNGSSERMHPFAAPIDALRAHPPTVVGFAAVLASSGMAADWWLRSRADTGTVHLVSQTLLLVSAAAFLHLGMAVLRRGVVPVWAGYELLLPMAWLLFRAVTSFMEYALITQSSGHMLELFSVLSLLLFLLFAGRFLSGGEKPSTRTLLVLTGLAAALFCFSSTVPTLIVRWFASGELRTDAAFPRLADLVMGLFSFSLLWMPLGADVAPVPVAADGESDGTLPENEGDGKNIF